ncbi:hypothetical protein MMPV_003532 [Pyropia vietnamensis]
MITLRNTQRTIPLSLPLVTAQLRLLRAALGRPTAPLAVWLASDAAVRSLNGKYRGVRAATDVLSFPAAAAAWSAEEIAAVAAAVGGTAPCPDRADGLPGLAPPRSPVAVGTPLSLTPGPPEPPGRVPYRGGVPPSRAPPFPFPRPDSNGDGGGDGDDTAATDDDDPLGDLIVSVPYVARAAAARPDLTLSTHLPRVLAHGMAHLAGHDHDNPTAAAEMAAAEEHALAAMWEGLLEGKGGHDGPLTHPGEGLDEGGGAP